VSESKLRVIEMKHKNQIRNRRHRLLWCTLILCASIGARQTAQAQADSNSFLDDFVDPQDGYLDLSKHLMEKQGILPVPILITEPAVGFGGGLAAAYLHRPKDPNSDRFDMDEGSTSPKRSVPPSITGLGAIATENGTWGVGIGHLGIWDEDRWRYTGALAYGDVNLSFYRPDNGRNDFGGLHYNLKAWFLNQQLERRIADSNFFLGGRYLFTDVDSTFSRGNNVPGVKPREYQSGTAGAGMTLGYDSRDNIFTPSRGLRAQAIALPAFGSLWLRLLEFSP